MLALVAARWRGRWPDAAVRVFCSIGVAVPDFVVGLGLLSLVVVRLGLGRVVSAGTPANVWLLATLLGSFVLGPLLWRTSTTAIDTGAVLSSPSRVHPLGIDQLGRDELGRLLAGGERTLTTIVAVLTLALAVGLILGVTAAMAGRLLDGLLTRAVDLFLAMPNLVLVLVLLTVLGPGYVNLVLAVATGFAMYYARLARSYALDARQRPVVIAAQMAGIPAWRVAWAHVMPPAATKLLVLATHDGGHVTISVAGLSFLGFGAQPPTADWGVMLADSKLYLAGSPWLLLAPGLAIVALVLGVNLLSAALNDLLRPRGSG